MRLFQILILLYFITACQNITVSSNVNDFLISSAYRNIAENEVLDLSYPQLYQYNFTAFGAAVVQSCVKERFDRLPSQSEMLKKLKTKALKQGANAVVFDACQIRTEFNSCRKHKECRAELFLVDI